MSIKLVGVQFLNATPCRAAVRSFTSNRTGVGVLIEIVSTEEKKVFVWPIALVNNTQRYALRKFR